MTEKPWLDLEYGVVAVVRGHHAGKLGYYDDDSDTGSQAIVFLNGAPVGGDYELIWKKWIRQATPAETKRWQAQHLNELAYHRAFRKER